MRLSPKSLFGQLAVLIALVLLGAAVLAVALGREYASRPGAEQLLRGLRGYALMAEALVEEMPPAQARERLRALGLHVAEDAPPPRRREPLLPFLRDLVQQADGILGGGRALRAARDRDGTTLHLRLDTDAPIWIRLQYRADRNPVRFSLLLLAGCALLVWIAAAVYARRIVRPLRALASESRGIARGEPPAIDAARAPREVAELATALQRAGADVRAAASERALMLAGISHDLRTPLTRLQFALELVPDADPALREGMSRDIAEMDAILTQFIAWARDGRDEPLEPVDLAGLCRSVVAASGANWSESLPATAMLRARPIALTRALENLVVNALRHGRPPYDIALSRERDGWRVDVRDHGDGIAPGQRDALLQPFASGNGGSGLGLAIADRVARQHGGRLRLSEAPDGGLVATITLRDA